MGFLRNWYIAIGKFLNDRGYNLNDFANTLHLYGSFLIVILLVVFGVNVWLATGITLCIGILKELFDCYITGVGFSWSDILFDVIGIACGLLFCGGIRLV
jgi:VanZ family protein